MLAALLLTVALGAAPDLTREEALGLVFPGAAITDERIFLTAAQQARATSLAGEGIPSALVARYTASRDGQIVGRAYIDTNVVRTKKETLLVSLDARGRVKRIDVTAFLEPAEYTPPRPWLGQYSNRELDDEVAVNRAIRPIAGATLTARAVNAAVRRVMAIDEVLREAGSR